MLGRGPMGSGAVGGVVECCNMRICLNWEGWNFEVKGRGTQTRA